MLVSVDTHLLCLMRSDVQGSQVDARSMCYQSYKPDPPLEPPLSDFLPAYHQVAVGGFNEQLGIVLLSVIPCTEFFPGILAVSAGIGIWLDKAGGPGTGINVVTADTTAPFDCADGEQTTGPVTLTPLAQSHDEDQDGCSDWEELGTDQYAGGLRDPFNYWDFYDTPDQKNQRDKVVDLVNDLMRVADRFDATGDPSGDPLQGPIPPPPAYHTAFDRSPAIGPDVWNLGPADGTIDLVNDVFAVADQFDHSCVAAP